MNPETRRQFDRWLRRERISRIMDIAPPAVIAVGLVVGVIWLRGPGGPPWIGLALAGAAALAKPALMAIRVLENRRRRKQMD
jgi:hypothetical protein